MSRGKILLDVHDVAKISDLAGKGLNVAQIAAALGISKSTLERRAAEDSDAKEALDRGRAQADGAVIAAAFEMAKSGKYPTMSMFWLRARCGWKEPAEEQHLIEVKLAYSIDELSD